MTRSSPLHEKVHDIALPVLQKDIVISDAPSLCPAPPITMLQSYGSDMQPEIPKRPAVEMIRPAESNRKQTSLSHPLPIARVPCEQTYQQSRKNVQDNRPNEDLAESEPSGGRIALSRSRNGCYTCRKRKVKCDENRPICMKCKYTERDCCWPPDDPFMRRRNRPRKMRLHLVSSERRSETAEEWAASPSNENVPIRGDSRPPQRVPMSTLNAFAATLPSLGSIKSHNKGLIDCLMPGTLRAQMMMDPSFLEPYFRTVDERLIIRHYLSHTVHISIAFDSPKSGWNPWLTIIAPLAFTHLPGISAAADALRTSLLAVGSVHLHYIANPSDQTGACRITNLARPTVLALVRKALESRNEDSSAADKREVDMILAALLTCTIASSLAADDSWHPLLLSILSLISEMGGAQSLLQDASRDRLSPCRFVLEQLAIRDVFGCMTTGLTPSILSDAFTPWFFEAESWSCNDREWESVERMFGISRGMVDLIARTCSLVGKVREKGQFLPESYTLPPNNWISPIQAAGTGYLDDLSSTTMVIRVPGERDSTSLIEEADGLMAELKVWDEACNFTPFHPRTQYGNIAYRHAMKIRLLRDVFQVPRNDSRIRCAALAIIELASEMFAHYGTMVWFTWPIVIAGFQLDKGDAARQVVLNLLTNFGPHACFDVGAASRMVIAFWTYQDNDQESDISTWEFARRLGSRPFLD